MSMNSVCQPHRFSLPPFLLFLWRGSTFRNSPLPGVFLFLFFFFFHTIPVFFLGNVNSIILSKVFLSVFVLPPLFKVFAAGNMSAYRFSPFFISRFLPFPRRKLSFRSFLSPLPLAFCGRKYVSSLIFFFSRFCLFPGRKN